MNHKELITLLEGADDNGLFAEADRLRRQEFGDSVFLRGIVEFSSHCGRSCAYCGLRGPNTNARRYRLTPEEIHEAAGLATAHGLGTVVLQSGEDAAFTPQTLAGTVARIKSEGKVAVTLSIGEQPDDVYRLWRENGADRYLLKLESLDRNIHESLRPGRTLNGRIDRLHALRRLGYEIGSGIIVGLPGVDSAMLARDIEKLTELELDMISAGPFIPHPETPLADARPGSVILTHRVNALLRILNPLANIPATSALGVRDPEGRNTALSRGVNVIMPSLTPQKVRGGYTIYPGKNALSVEENLRVIIHGIRSAGFTPTSAEGQSPRYTAEARAAEGRLPSGEKTTLTG